MKEMTTLHDLLVDELKDLYSAEKQIVKSLPRLIKRASSGELSNNLQRHLDETEDHISRLEQAFAELSVPARAKKCKGMEGVLEEGEEMLDLEGDPDVIDAGIIGAAQKVEHYEIAAYGTAVAHAKTMGHTNVESLLQSILDEEHAANDKLTSIAEGFINRLANAEDTEEERPAHRARRSARDARSEEQPGAGR